MTPQSATSISSNEDREILQIGWFFYLAEIALKRIIHNVVIRQYRDRSHTNLDQLRESKDCYRLEKAVQESDTQIQEWYRYSYWSMLCSTELLPTRYDTLPPQVKFDKRPEAPCHDILRFILRGHMIDIIELARFPAVQTILASSTCILSDGLSPVSVRLTREFLQNAVYRIEANCEGFYHRHQGTWLLLRSASRSALQLLGMAIRCQVEGGTRGLARQELEAWFLPDRWWEAVQMVSKFLEYWSNEARDVERLSVVLKELIRHYQTSSDMLRAAG
jgi:hypothetical protein